MSLATNCIYDMDYIKYETHLIKDGNCPHIPRLEKLLFTSGVRVSINKFIEQFLTTIESEVGCQIENSSVFLTSTKSGVHLVLMPLGQFDEESWVSLSKSVFLDTLAYFEHHKIKPQKCVFPNLRRRDDYLFAC